MKLNVFNRKKTALEKLTSTYDVKLDASASQLIMDVLAKLYDNPVEAAIREYVSNAYDANVEAGSTEPVHLHVPTEDEPYLEVSDTGNGLDYLGIVSVFANFGTSTKRDSNEFIGGFGIGSKSGLAILKALYRVSRRYEPKSHNLSFDQKLFIDALCVKGIKTIGKKDAAKIVKRLKLLFPDELKLIKDTADEIVHKVQL